jgi:pyrimidine-nucleoside phosphorylase
VWAPDIVRRTRDGSYVAPEEVAALVEGYTGDAVTDAQMAAWAMAVCWKGLPRSHTVALTRAMRDSGHVFSWPQDRPTVDKHSTGGVGDKVSLALAPLVAACGVRVPMISGRGLGHTGGTLDKLSCIPGFRYRLERAEFVRVVERCGFVLAGQSEDVAPADRRLYALRDSTATVESVPLITASILSKKLAEGLDRLVLDVKVGSGAFMKDQASAVELADSLIEVAGELGCRTVALLTDMGHPIGRAVGNANELEEAVAFLRGEGPEDLAELVFALGDEMLGGGRRAELEAARSSGTALSKLLDVVKAQGGDPDAIERPDRWREGLPQRWVKAREAGGLAGTDAAEIGRAAMVLGAGRRRPEDRIDPWAGIDLSVRVGDRVGPGDPLARLVARDERGMDEAEARFRRALRWGEAERPRTRILERRGS